jgi:two-component system NarL family sensor kinase
LLLKPVDTSEEFLVAILAGSILFLLFACFIIAYILIYRKRRKSHHEEIDRIKLLFNEELLKSRLEIQEHTFTHISQEIHDNVGQILSLAKIQLNIMDEKDLLDRIVLSDAQENISQAMNDLRDIAKGLSSERILMLNLKDTIQQELQRINKTGMFKAVVVVNGTEQPINVQKKLIIFRIIQESLQNIIKHARATLIDISINYKPDYIEVLISDDGQGFDVNTKPNGEKGLGLMNMINRATIMGGKLEINSILEKGTEISLIIPYG